ncbi:MAG: radical SAM protein [Candidatus Pacearchaeota archaeon]|jgi:MoaA/NifB/PqqE/SkfB family radical SAM enzyme
MQKLNNLDITWTIDAYCNYDCPYCQIPRIDKKLKIKKIETSNIKSLFKNISNSNIILSGGEPFLFTDIIKICQLIIKNNNNLSIVTNLSSDIVYEFADKIDPKKIGNISASLHLTELKKFNSKKEFIERYNYLVKKGFHVEVTIVMWPPIFKNFEKIYKEFVSYGMHIIPLSFLGKYNGKNYPNDYTKEELEIIKRYSKKTDINYNDKYKRFGEITHSRISFKGKLCLSGMKSLVINADGSIRRCFSESKIIGHINNPNNINAFKEAKFCESEISICPMECFTYCLEKEIKLKMKLKKKSITSMLNKIIR